MCSRQHSTVQMWPTVAHAHIGHSIGMCCITCEPMFTICVHTNEMRLKSKIEFQEKIFYASHCGQHAIHARLCLFIAEM